MLTFICVITTKGESTSREEEQLINLNLFRHNMLQIDCITRSDWRENIFLAHQDPRDHPNYVQGQQSGFKLIDFTGLSITCLEKESKKKLHKIFRWGQSINNIISKTSMGPPSGLNLFEVILNDVSAHYR